MIRVALPYHLRTLARIDGEVLLEVESPATVSAVLDALEARHPVLRGTIRDQTTWQRRPFRPILRLPGRPLARSAGQLHCPTRSPPAERLS